MSTFVFFAAILFFIGVFLMTSYVYISAANPPAQASEDVTNCILGIYTIGVVFVTLAVTTLFIYTAICGKDNKEPFTSSNFYLGFVASLGLVLLILASIIKAEGNSDDMTANGFLISIILVGSIMFVSATGIKIWEFVTKKAFFGGSSSLKKKSEYEYKHENPYIEDVTKARNFNEKIEEIEMQEFKPKDSMQERLEQYSEEKNKLRTIRQGIEINNNLIKNLTRQKEAADKLNVPEQSAEIAANLAQAKQWLQKGESLKKEVASRVENLGLVTGQLTKTKEERERERGGIPGYGMGRRATSG